MTLKDRLRKLEAQMIDLQGQLAALRRHVRMKAQPPAPMSAQPLKIQWLDEAREPAQPEPQADGTGRHVVCEATGDILWLDEP